MLTLYILFILIAKMQSHKNWYTLLNDALTRQETRVDVLACLSVWESFLLQPLAPQ